MSTLRVYWPAVSPPLPGVLYGWICGERTGERTLFVPPRDAPLCSGVTTVPLGTWGDDTLNVVSGGVRLTGDATALRLCTSSATRLVTILYHLPRRTRRVLVEAPDGVLQCFASLSACSLSPPPSSPALPPPRSCSAVLAEVETRLRNVSARRVSLVFASLDTLLGVAVGAAVWRHSTIAETWLRSTVASLLQGLPVRGAAWLIAAKPAGVKLHEPLCVALSTALVRFAGACASLNRASALARPAVVCLAAAGVAGASMQAAVLSDVVSLVTLPLEALRLVARRWLRLHVAGLCNLWRKLYRGSGAEAYRVERLTMGALLLAPMVLLAPTLCAYAALVAALSAPCSILRTALRGAPWRARQACRASARRDAVSLAWLEPTGVDAYTLHWR